jgi:hypothetical protein
MKEVKKEKWENEKEGGESPPRSFVSNPSFLFYILKFLLAKIQQNMFFYDKSLFFYLTVPPLSEATLRTKSLRKLAERSKSSCASALPGFMYQ